MSMNRPFDGQEESVEYCWIVSYHGQRLRAYDDTDEGKAAALDYIKRWESACSLTWGIV